jgi:hypothetical protein
MSHNGPELPDSCPVPAGAPAATVDAGGPGVSGGSPMVGTSPPPAGLNGDFSRVDAGPSWHLGSGCSTGSC